MAFSAMVRKLLVSAPGDVPDSDWNLVVFAVLRWNQIYGESFGASVIPVRWKEHAGAEHGVHPQDAINHQLVDDADGVLALFWNRLGTQTKVAESGTAEEIERSISRGMPVGLLRCIRATDTSSIDPEQLILLKEFLEQNRSNSLIMQYGNDLELTQHVDTFLTRMVTTDQVKSGSLVSQTITKLADVWARIETQDRPKTDSKGRIKNNRSWFLTLYNSGESAARRVHFDLELEDGSSGDLPIILGDSRDVETIPPGGEMKWNLAVHMGVAEQARCVVTWLEGDEEKTNVVTLRFF